MITFLKKYSDSYYHGIMKSIKLNKKINLIPVDFSKPWWAILSKRPFLWSFVFTTRVIVYMAWVLAPLIIGLVIEQGNPTNILLFIGLILFLEGGMYLAWTVYVIGLYQAILSVKQSAYTFFLTIDPIYHATRSTGELFGKIERCDRAYEDLLDVFMIDFLPVAVGVSTVVIAFMSTQVTLGFLAILLLAIVGIINVIWVLFNTYSFDPHYVKADDRLRNAAMESLTQIQLIRTTFATNEWNNKVRHYNKRLLGTIGTYWLAFDVIASITRCLYTISFGLISYYILMLIKQDTLTVVQGVSLAVTYLHGSRKIIDIGRRVQKLSQSLHRVSDLFKFIGNFGKKTFPVLSSDESLEEIPKLQDEIRISMRNIYFAYHKKAVIFDNHNLILNVPQSQKNKLYGIIGPSGIGKTTLLSILGGQIHPSHGTVTINGIDIYHLDDLARRQLIAIQAQTAASVSGTLRDNLLLGLPYNKEFDDNKLISVLRKVGLWHLFEHKLGLNSTVGEGGLTLSVGQRQRLNFASLYLRAKHYKPVLILIDEPTSSLDPLSEQAITHMIDELARHAITIVIAHRIHTLQQAEGILDFSLITKQKDLIFYPPAELAKHSAYYQKLVKGEAPLD